MLLIFARDMSWVLRIVGKGKKHRNNSSLNAAEIRKKLRLWARENLSTRHDETRFFHRAIYADDQVKSVMIGDRDADTSQVCGARSNDIYGGLLCHRIYYLVKRRSQ